MTWKILSFFLDSDAANSQNKLSKCWVLSYHVSPNAQFLQMTDTEKHILDIVLSVDRCTAVQHMSVKS